MRLPDGPCKAGCQLTKHFRQKQTVSNRPHCGRSERAAKEPVIKKLAIIVESAPEQQARILVDGTDWLGPEMLGLDPEMLEAELHKAGPGTVVVGRCGSGIVGCHDRKVSVTRTERYVEWAADETKILRFDPIQYDTEIARFAQDKSWESTERTVEREMRALFREANIRGGFEFEWASARERAGMVRLAFRKGRHQKFLKFDWDGAKVEDAIAKAKVFRAMRFKHLG